MTLTGKSNTVLFCCIGTNYDGSNYFGVQTCNVNAGGVNFCIRNGIIVGIS